jgi:hypothetical protein
MEKPPEFSSSEGSPGSSTDTFSLRGETESCIRPDDAWRANLERMALKATRSPDFYDRAGSTVQRLADELRGGGAAHE